MKDTNKYSIYIYIIIPVLIAIWPALVLGVYLPGAQKQLKNDISSYSDAKNIMLEILTLEPERIEASDPNKEVEEFSYNRVINEIASLCKIPSGNCKWNTGKAIESKTSKTQIAGLRLSGVDITSFAKFLSIMQSRWPKLETTLVKLTKKENSPDEWDILIDFKYYYTTSD